MMRGESSSNNLPGEPDQPPFGASAFPASAGLPDFPQLPLFGAEGEQRSALAPTRPSLGTPTRGTILRSAAVVALILMLMSLLIARIQAAQRVVKTTPGTGVSVGGHPLATDFTLHTWAWWNSDPKSLSQATQAAETIHLAALRGKVVVINFWASWCDPCRAEAPSLEAAWLHYQSQGVVFVGVDVNDTAAPSAAFLKQYHITYFSGPDQTSTITVGYGVFGLPSTFFIDRQGRVASKHIGLIDAKTLNQSIQQTLS